jgi:hypothetical protein
MSTETDATNPVEAADTSAASTGVDGQGQAPNDDISTDEFDRMPAPDEDDGDGAPDSDAEGDAPKPEADKPQASADDEEEVELSDGRKVKAPKELALGYMRQGDYTQKTQALAEQRRQHEEAVSTWQSQQTESLKTFRAEHVAIANSEAQLSAIEADLSKYRSMSPADWAALKAQDPNAYQAHTENFDILRRTKLSTEETLESVRKELSTKEAKAREDGDKARNAAIAEAFQKAGAVLEREIPGWSTQRWGEVAKFAETELGYKAEELQQATDPRAWKMANEIMSLRAENAKLKTAAKQQTAAKTNEKAQSTKPAEKPAGAAAPRGVNDSLDTKAWMARREAQLARKAAAR